MTKTKKEAPSGGAYRRMMLEQQGQGGLYPSAERSGFFRIRFYVGLCLFIAYVLLDYTKARIYTVDSNRIYAEISRDMTGDWDLKEALSHVFSSVWISDFQEESLDAAAQEAITAIKEAKP